MPRVTDPALLQQLGTPAAGPVFSAPPRPPAGFAPPGAVASIAPITGGPEDPRYVGQRAGAAAAATAPIDAQKEIQVATAKAALDVSTSAAKAQQEKDIKAQLTPAAKASHSFAVDNILSTIEQARNNLNPWTTSYGSMLSEIPGTEARDLKGTYDTIRSNLTFDRLQQMRNESPTGGAVGNASDADMRLLGATVASLDQGASKDKQLDSLARIEANYRRLRAQMNGDDPNNPNIASAYGIMPAPALPGQSDGAPPGGAGTPPAAGGTPLPGSPTPGDPLTFAQGKTRTEADPTMAGVNNHIREMIGALASPEQIVAYMNQVRPGLGDSKASDVAAAIAFRKQNPRVPLSNYPVSVENRDVPMSGFRAGLNAAAQSAPGAFAMNAGDAISMGTLDNLTGNPALARAGMTGASHLHPAAAMAGTLTGGALAAGGLESGLGLAGVGRGIGLLAPRALGADALYGGGYGAGSADDGNRLTGGLEGAVAGIGGGILGRGLVAGAGRAATGIKNSAVARLNDAGIPMTLGQLVGQSGTLGKFAKGVEDRFAGLPAIGDIVNARRLEGVRGFNEAAFDQGLAPINATTGGVTGEQGIDLARAARSKAYDDALGGVQVTADQPFINDMGATIRQGQALPDPMGTNADFTLRTRVGNSFDNGGNLTGNGFQQSVRGLRRDAKSMANLPYGYDFGQVTRGAEDALTGMLDRQVPGVMPAYNAANAANRNVEVLRDAVTRARNGTRVGEPGLFAPSQLADAASSNASKFGNSQGTTNQPFFDLTRAGQNVLPSKITDSGTAGRLALPAALGLIGGTGGGIGGAVGGDEKNRFGDAAEGAAGGALKGAALGAALMLPATRGGTKLLQALLTKERPAVVDKAGQALRKYYKVGGMFGNQAALQYYGLGGQ